MVRNSRRKEDRPDEIVTAAFQEFAECGYADAKLDRVARRAGVSKGLVFVYFKTKEHLFKAVVRTVVIPRIAEFEAAMAGHDASLAEFLRGPFVDLAAALPESPARHVLRLIIAEGPKHPDLTEWYYEQVVGRLLAALRTLLARAEERGEIREGVLARHPQLIIAPVVVSIVWKLLFDRYEPLANRELIETHVDMLLAALATDGETPA